MTRSLSRSASSIAVLIMVAAILATACTAGQGAASSTPGSTTRASSAPAPSVALTPTPTPTAAPAATPQVLSDAFAALEPGRRYAFPSRGTNPGISFTVPSGWTGNQTFAAKDYGDSGPVGPLLFDSAFDHGFKNPCTDHTPVVPAAGSGAAGLLGVIAGQPGIDAGPITDVTVGGHDGKYVDYTVTVDPATCGSGEDPFWIWGTCPAPVTIGCENTTWRPAVRGLEERPRACLCDRRRRQDRHVLREPAGRPPGRRSPGVPAGPRLDHIRTRGLTNERSRQVTDARG